jgi:oxygen-dependent protoporphyrinogen oxidase
VIRSGRAEGHLLDWGPQRARLTAPLSKLIDEVGLRDQLVTAPAGLDLFVYRSGRLRRVPFSAAGFLGSDLVGPLAKLRALLEPLTAGSDPGESVARYFTRKLGRETYETMVGPLYGGLYGSDPADMRVGLSLQHVLDEFGVGRSLVLHLLRRGGTVKPPPACSFRDGMQALPEALARSLGDRVRLATPVLGLRPRGAAWSVETEAETIEASQVVITAPAAAAARLLESPEPIAITTDKRGTPLWMHWRGRRLALSRADGPERLSGEWWHAEPFAREYWRCESEELGQDLLLYRDSAGWRLQGWYD